MNPLEPHPTPESINSNAMSLYSHVALHIAAVLRKYPASEVREVAILSILGYMTQTNSQRFDPLTLYMVAKTLSELPDIDFDLLTSGVESMLERSTQLIESDFKAFTATQDIQELLHMLVALAPKSSNQPKEITAADAFGVGTNTSPQETNL